MVPRDPKPHVTIGSFAFKNCELILYFQKLKKKKSALQKILVVLVIKKAVTQKLSPLVVNARRQLPGLRGVRGGAWEEQAS